MKFQYFSDIHTEQYKSNHKKLKRIQEFIIPSAPYLIIAGDIGDPFSNLYKEFLSYLSLLFEHIFIVAGNHEYYGQHDMFEVQEEIKNFTVSLGNVTFLENDIFHIPNTNISIYGATFWSDIQKNEEDDIKYYITDYRCIPNFSIENSKQLYVASCDNLNNALDTFTIRNFVIISHHLPLYSLLDPKYLGAKPSLSSAFASNIVASYNPRILAWVAGHTHKSCEYGKFHVNPIGYKDENLKYDYNKTFEIQLNPHEYI